jgi:hypothetical protein
MVLSDGDVPALLALRAAADRGEGAVLVWPMAAPGPEAGARLKAVRHQAELVGARLFGPGSVGERDEGLAVELVRASAAAAEAGCLGAIWPVSAGETNRGDEALRRMSGAVERALHVSRLVAVESPGFELSAPYADLSDRQIADLILDMDLPVWTCWWYAVDRGDPAAAIAEAQREHWAAMLAAAGWRGALPGPGAKVTARAV